jgi:hypothetical protein
MSVDGVDPGKKEVDEERAGLQIDLANAMVKIEKCTPAPLAASEAWMGASSLLALKHSPGALDLLEERVCNSKLYTNRERTL